jgi:hypothetical protein
MRSEEWAYDSRGKVGRCPSCCDGSLETGARRSPAQLVLEIDMRQLLPVTVEHDIAGFLFFDEPQRREATSGT